MVWFSLDGYALLRFCGALAILLFLYYLLFDQKAHYRHCRIYLLISVGVALVSAVIRIPVYSAVMEQNIEKWMYAEERTNDISVSVRISEETPGSSAVSPVVGTEQTSLLLEETITEINSGGDRRAETHRNATHIFWGVYLLVTLFLTLRWCLAIVKILRLKKWGSCSCEHHFTIVRNNRVAAPFSFFRTIYIDRKLTGMTLDVVLLHERSHIEHRHYRDTFLIELFSVVFWFNPCVWLIKRELRALHEFEVDHSLLSKGVELSEYQITIFGGLMGYSPDIANGFHNSLIKKRFIMMKRGNTIRYALLRKVLLLPAVAAVMALFAFTVKVSDSVTEKDVALLTITDLQEDSLSGWGEEIDLVVPAGRDSLIPAVSLQQFRDPMKETVIVRENEIPVEEGATTVEVKPIPKRVATVNEKRDEIDEGKALVFREDQLVESIIPFQNKTIIRYVELRENETLVTIAVPAGNPDGWIKFNKGYSLVDEKTDDIYKIRSVTRGIPLNKVVWMTGKTKQMLEFTMIFPPLKSRVKEVSFCDKFPEESGQTPVGGTPWVWRNIKTADYRPPKERAEYYYPDGRRKFERKLAHQTLTADQIIEKPGGFVYKTTIDKIEIDKNETRVTLAVPMNNEHTWTLFDKGICIVDCRNGDEYQIRSLTRGMKLSTALWIDGKRKRMVLFTMVFPPLKPRVKFFDLYTKYLEETVPAPGAGEHWEWRNVKVADYVFPKGNIIY